MTEQADGPERIRSRLTGRAMSRTWAGFRVAAHPVPERIRRDIKPTHEIRTLGLGVVHPEIATVAVVQ